MSTKTTQKTRKMVFLAMMTAIIVVLQVIATFTIRFGVFPITLALAPIIIGAAMYGWGAGTFLGFVFGLIVFLTGILGWDGGGVNAMMAQNAFATTVLCLGKGTVAGLVAGLVYKLGEKKNSLTGVILSGIATPIVNTGIFAVGMLTIFYNFLVGGSAETSYTPVAYLFFGMIGFNFIIELIVNLALATVINRIIVIGSKKRR